MLTQSIKVIFCVILLFTSFNGAYAQDGRVSADEYLYRSLSINDPRDHRHNISRRLTVQDSTWMEWLRRTGELPPDFAQMPSIPNLPDPLEWQGKAITTTDDWAAKRDWIKEQYQYWVSGHRPPAPENVRPTMLSDRMENGVRIQLIRLNFGPSMRAAMTFELMIPPQSGILPVYMTQWTHRDWAHLALRRGYISCVYAGADDMDDTQEYQRLYPEYDFTCLMRRAWGASRVIDYLVTRPEVDKTKIAITGHSRNGKQSLWAAAFDDRIAAVVTSSCGTGGVTPYRYSDPQFCTQTLDDIASNAAHWFQPRLRFFFGHEDRLPVDQNLLLSLIAPRGLLIHYSIMERQLSPWATEQCYQSVRKVYSFLYSEDQIGILPRMGEHPVATRDLENCLDFLDIRFGRKEGAWHNKLYCAYSFDEWKEKSAKGLDYKAISPQRLAKHKDKASFGKQRGKIVRNLNWLLGDAPQSVASVNVDFTTPGRIDWIDAIIGRPRIKNGHNLRIGPYSAMNDHLSGYLYSPDTISHKNIPVIIYLHQYDHAHGCAYGYGSFNSPTNTELFQRFVDDGFAVLAIDMVGFGARVEEGAEFYGRFPAWSKMGQMVADVKACVDAVSFFPFLDKRNVFVVGNTIGGATGLFSAVLDDRIKGVAVVSAFSPWRDASSDYSLKNYSHSYGFIPRLGFWLADRENAPVDFMEILSCVAPRPLLVISPRLDRHANQKAVRESVDKVREVYSLYGQKDNLRISEPMEINRLTNQMADEILQFLKKQL